MRGDSDVRPSRWGEFPVVAVPKKKEGLPMHQGSTKRTLTILGTD